MVIYVTITRHQAGCWEALIERKIFWWEQEVRSGLAKRANNREKEKLDGNERREIGNRSLKSSHIFLQTEGEQKRPSQLQLGCSKLLQAASELFGWRRALRRIIRNFSARLTRLAGSSSRKKTVGIEYQEISSASLTDWENHKNCCIGKPENDCSLIKSVYRSSRICI